MKARALLSMAALLLAAQTAVACGTRLPAVQAQIDAADLAELLELTRVATQEADAIFIGTVTALVHPTIDQPERGSVRLAVEQTLKGDPSPVQAARWKTQFTFACRQSASFHDVGFRAGGRFIVYVRHGEVTRSAAADHLRSGLLGLDQERAIAAGGDPI
ncbi:conserved exported hypothetical protein [Luteimonas sp. 9C]|uniref:hypothetical protein n=1 Tax=Luteimonas sp. 9C TaxID=2653148 RepID=UPI0012F1A6C7|nr:hypothetical protein [Luteimonas sp. 9C]VXB16743.1 conserved exported hypothetical protein [Luteimonas sp. 9C]